MTQSVSHNEESLSAGPAQGAQGRICSRCIIDTTVPGAVFDQDGVCNYCHLQDRLENEYPLGEKSERFLGQLFDQIKHSGRKSPYNCVVGISGGRDSVYTLYLVKKVWGLNPVAVHFNDGFGNPVAGENMKKATDILDVPLRTVTSDWRETKDLRLSFLKASTPDMECGTDIGIASALYGTAVKEGIRTILIGQSFRTEGIAPLEWNYLDGKYLKTVHDRFGTIPLRPPTAEDPGFSLSVKLMMYYSMVKRIRTVPILYYVNYVRPEAEKIIVKELGWVNTGAHYFDDLYQSLMFYVHRVKFNIDRRKYNYSALIRSGQMTRDEALKLVASKYVIEDDKVIQLCIKRLGLSQEEFDEIMALEPKTFRDYPTSYNFLKTFRIPIKLLSMLHLLPSTTYAKYFECG